MEQLRAREFDSFDSDDMAHGDPLALLVLRCGWTPLQVALGVVVVYGIVEKLVLPGLQGYLSLLSGPLRDWRPDPEALLTGFVEFPVIFGFYVWSLRSIPELFASLEQNETFRDNTAYLGVRDKVVRRFSLRRWAVVSAAIAVGVGFGVLHLYLWENDIPVVPWFEEGGNLARSVTVLLVILAIYALAQIVIREVVLVVSLRDLWKECGDDLVLRGSRDSAGGLEAIARHITSMTVLVIAVALTFAMASLLPAIREEEVGSFALWIGFIWVLYAVIVVALLGFILWPAHTRMVEHRRQRLGDVNDQIERAMEEAEEAAGDPDALARKVAELDALRRLHGWLDAELPKWPLPRSVRQQLRWSVIVPVAYSLAMLFLDLRS